MKNWIKLSIIIMGFSGLIAQVLLLRELLIIFSVMNYLLVLFFQTGLYLRHLDVLFQAKKPKEVKTNL